jgi:hypothetical protein
VWDAEHGPPRTAKLTPGEGDERRGSARDARWELTVEPTAPPLRHLAAPLYRTPLPRTKLESTAPAARISGTVAAGDRTLTLDAWPGMTGHNWGAQHAERWLWLHGIAFDGAPGAWLDLAAGRVRVGPVTTPWILNGALHVDGATRRLRGRPDVDARPGAATVALGDVTIDVTAPPDQTVAWVYADPPGGEHHALNCSIATLRLTVAGRTLTTAHGGVYELGIRERDHGVPVAPFPDP